MKNKLLIFIFSILAINPVMTSCDDSSSGDGQVGFTNPDDIDPDLVALKIKTDTSINNGRYYTEVLAKEVGKLGLTLVKNQNWPENMEKVYNVWRDENDQIRLIAVSPLHNNQGLNLVFDHYFDDNQQTFAFVSTVEFLKTTCSLQPLYEKEITFYDEDMDIEGRVAMISDEGGNQYDYVNCHQEITKDLEYQVSPNVETYLARINEGK